MANGTRTPALGEVKPTIQESETSSQYTKYGERPGQEVENIASSQPQRTNRVARFPSGENDNPVTDVKESETIEITEEDCWEELGYSFSNSKKWLILSVIFMVQLSMNFNTSLYSNAIEGITHEFNVSAQAARCGAMIFLVLYAFGFAIAPNFATIMVGRALGGLSSAGGSVTLGMIADMWDADNQQYAVAFVSILFCWWEVLWAQSFGGFVEANLAWRWNIWIQLIFGGVVQILHLFLVPETRTTLMMDKIAKKMRKSGQNPNIYGPNELTPFKERFSLKETLITFVRPFKMFLTEPIVLTLTKPDDEHAQFESRLWFLLWTAPCLPIGIIGFAWTSTGPPIHWIGSCIFAGVVGIANYSIYMATIDYMICAYGPYSASATGGNGWSRDFLAGVLTIPATPFFQNLSSDSSRSLAYASTILACVAFILVIAVYVIYFNGPALRRRSPFAQQLSDARAAHEEITHEKEHHASQEAGAEEGAGTGAKLSRMPTGARAKSFIRTQQDIRLRQNTGSRPHSTHERSNPNSRANSRVNSRANSRANSPTRREMADAHNAAAISECAESSE
ncbi:hypothetical protein DID88_002685 [Monilinia fructigena]|uniref:Major facilitator superfamily (MFS) profile domain-containing protein n=1 Tax=Monilinia fructigena TaxID=38457 RepID=A0A395IPY0_9HELO|nr:hypothetical protein DID88_002685 [Monilinia fructigena]